MQKLLAPTRGKFFSLVRWKVFAGFMWEIIGRWTFWTGQKMSQIFGPNVWQFLGAFQIYKKMSFVFLLETCIDPIIVSEHDNRASEDFSLCLGFSPEDLKRNPSYMDGIQINGITNGNDSKGSPDIKQAVKKVTLSPLGNSPLPLKRVQFFVWKILSWYKDPFQSVQSIFGFSQIPYVGGWNQKSIPLRFMEIEFPLKMCSQIWKLVVWHQYFKHAS